MRVVLIIIALATIGWEKPAEKVSCLIVQPYVWAYGKDAAIAWARSKGYSEAKIAEVIKRCEKS
jgi:hypothetical protein